MPPPRSNYRMILVSLLVIVGLLTVTFGIVVVSSIDSDDDVAETAPPGSDDDTDDDPPDLPTEPPTEAELQEAVAEASEFVEQERGLEFEEEVAVELLADQEFTDRLLADFDEDAAELEELQVAYEALGLMPAGTDLAAVLREALGGGVIGFYDPETDELVVRGAALTPSVRVTLVHELTHALDDQHFELHRLAYDDDESEDGDGDGKPDELSFGFSTLVEGSASVVEEAYMDELTGDELDQYYAEQGALAADMPDVPMFLLSQIGAPYTLGPVFVGALDADGGQERVDGAFAAPPSTSEGVVHPEKYLEGEVAVDVPAPTADGEVVWEATVFGEFMIALVLAEEIDSDTAIDAAEGWGGDLMTTWRDGEQSCARVNLVGDTPDDTAEIHAAWTEWATAADVEATVEPAAPGEGPVTVTTCSAGGAAGGDGGSGGGPIGA